MSPKHTFTQVQGLHGAAARLVGPKGRVKLRGGSSGIIQINTSSTGRKCHQTCTGTIQSEISSQEAPLLFLPPHRDTLNETCRSRASAPPKKWKLGEQATFDGSTTGEGVELKRHAEGDSARPPACPLPIKRAVITRHVIGGSDALGPPA
ncbi:hypothetical protein JZ751_016052 [Albula glossodonta]|uniref:Uncharacterized protein n=1 Tax=Albula glossodonta TaxID=121402 RepID=A0A8T2NQG6_9TELE|nr:hypothetical protein JZ751_016052 [Albula glossodonta]